MTISDTNSEHVKAKIWRVALIVAGIFGAIALSIWPSKVGIGGWMVILMTAIAEEAIGRWLFYSRRNYGI